MSRKVGKEIDHLNIVDGFKIMASALCSWPDRASSSDVAPLRVNEREIWMAEVNYTYERVPKIPCESTHYTQRDRSAIGSQID